MWLAEAQRKIEQYPRSFVAAEIGRIVARAADLPSARLMPRQQEILSLLRTGISIDKIAARLRTSRNTVRVHITKIHRALGVRNRAELLAAASKDWSR